MGINPKEVVVSGVMIAMAKYTMKWDEKQVYNMTESVNIY